MQTENVAFLIHCSFVEGHMLKGSCLEAHQPQVDGSICSLPEELCKRKLLMHSLARSLTRRLSLIFQQQRVLFLQAQ